MRKLSLVKILMGLVLAFTCCMAAGCWDRRELADIGIVVGVGNDIDPQTGEILTTHQSVIPGATGPGTSSGAQGSSGAGRGGMQAVQMDHARGFTPVAALNRLDQSTSRSLYFNHVQSYIFGRQLAEQGLYQFVDFHARHPSARGDVYLAVAEGEASDILAIQDGLEKIPAVGLRDIMRKSAERSEYPVTRNLDFLNQYLSETSAPVMPMVGVLHETGAEGQPVTKMQLTGTAVFKKDKMVGVLNQRESRGLLWATGEVKRGLMEIPEAGMEITRANSKVVPEIEGDRLTIRIEIRSEALLLQYLGGQDLDPDLIQILQQRQEREIEDQVRAAVNRSQALNADIFGFGEAFRRRYQKQWQQIKPRWEELYPAIEVSIDVMTDIDEAGEVMTTLQHARSGIQRGQ